MKDYNRLREPEPVEEEQEAPPQEDEVENTEAEEQDD
jgi:hypothetical protein